MIDFASQVRFRSINLDFVVREFVLILHRHIGLVLHMVRSVSSAPGKVILFGEHAVVHGVTAIAAALSDLRIFADVVSILLFSYDCKYY